MSFPVTVKDFLDTDMGLPVYKASVLATRRQHRVPVRNQVIRHEGVWRHEGINPRILNLGTE